MSHLLWSLALVATFALGWTAAGVVRRPAPEVAGLEATVGRLQQQVGTLQARLQAREDVAVARTTAPAPRAEGSAPAGRPAPAALAAAVDGPASPPRPAATTATAAGGTGGAGGATVATVQSALERFYRYLEATRGGEGRERWREARALLDELRGMGEAAGQALMQVLATGTDSDERRAAARLLGSLQVAQALPLLRDVLDNDPDVLLRRAAASGLRQLQTPESLPVMERLVTSPAEDRLVRLSAAYGLAESGRPLGVSGLAAIFHEAALDGRGRELAFRALASLNDDRSLPFMRQVVASGAEPGYRLRAIRYLAAQGDGLALSTLHGVMTAPGEQPSIRDAAASAYRALGGR